jgi:hypothetical protein
MLAPRLHEAAVTFVTLFKRLTHMDRPKVMSSARQALHAQDKYCYKTQRLDHSSLRTPAAQAPGQTRCTLTPTTVRRTLTKNTPMCGTSTQLAVSRRTLREITPINLRQCQVPVGLQSSCLLHVHTCTCTGTAA